jgi:hypothetical protein
MGKSLVRRTEGFLKKNAHKVWLKVSKEMARHCFDKDANIDINKLQILRPFLEQDSFVRQPRFCHIFEGTQMLLGNGNSVRSEFIKVKDIHPLTNRGTSIIQASSFPR